MIRQSKCEPFSPLDHGALADGNTPDNTAIQAAIDSHGYLYLPYGSVFAITALRFTTGLRIFGGGTLILKGDRPAITVDGSSTGGATGMRIEDIHINQANWNHTNVQPVIHLPEHRARGDRRRVGLQPERFDARADHFCSKATATASASASRSKFSASTSSEARATSFRSKRTPMRGTSELSRWPSMSVDEL